MVGPGNPGKPGFPGEEWRAFSLGGGVVMCYMYAWVS
jgi:hypothetical protein